MGCAIVSSDNNDWWNMGSKPMLKGYFPDFNRSNKSKAGYCSAELIGYIQPRNDGHSHELSSGT